MPSITPSYLYTFVALIAISSMLIFSFMAYGDALRAPLEVKQLKNLMGYVAAKGTELLTLASTTNATTETFLQMPTKIGDRQYWLRLRNDSAKTWLEGGFGNTPTEGNELQVSLPKEALATGYYKSGYDAAHLECRISDGILQLFLSSQSEGDV
ncbi:MAG: hypothetical protein QHH18_06845 [Candidatus Bathyarchaeota archaeon]|nr:hypothetical protein [Candidatus Bathyarchaeota archaeon A05DMB-5]MDH7558299.1 hypothetical protein [Candidatus Bathyarchaeota archaeon]